MQMVLAVQPYAEPLFFVVVPEAVISNLPTDEAEECAKQWLDQYLLEVKSVRYAQMPEDAAFNIRLRVFPFENGEGNFEVVLADSFGNGIYVGHLKEILSGTAITILEKAAMTFMELNFVNVWGFEMIGASASSRQSLTHKQATSN